MLTNRRQVLIGLAGLPIAAYAGHEAVNTVARSDDPETVELWEITLIRPDGTRECRVVVPFADQTYAVRIPSEWTMYPGNVYRFSARVMQAS